MSVGYAVSAVSETARQIYVMVSSLGMFIFSCFFGGGLTAVIRRATRFGAGPFGFSSSATAREVAQKYKSTLDGSVAIVTGPSLGSIGYTTCLELARAGATVVMGGRSAERVEAARAAVANELPKAKLDTFIVDVASTRSVRAAVETLKKKYPKINIIVNNAGMMGGSHTLTEDGIERTLGTDHLGGFLLTELLIDNVRAAAAEQGGVGGRIVNVASVAAMKCNSWNKRDIFDLNIINDPSQYHEFDAYARAKFANVVHARALAIREAKLGTGVVAFSLMPGIIPTNFGRAVDSTEPAKWSQLGTWLLRSTPIPYLKDTQQGAATTLLCAAAPVDTSFDVVAATKAAAKAGVLPADDATAPKLRSGTYYDDVAGSTFTPAAMVDANVLKDLWVLSAKLAKTDVNVDFLNL